MKRPNVLIKDENQGKNSKINTMKQNYCDLRRDWIILVLEWFFMSYFGSSYAKDIFGKMGKIM